jgi:predicted DNA-binding transcriptional regulator AlpA
MQILRPSETAAKVGLCDRQLRDLEAQGLFPKRFQLNPNGGRAVGHFAHEVDQWLAERGASREAA